MRRPLAPGRVAHVIRARVLLLSAISIGLTVACAGHRAASRPPRAETVPASPAPPAPDVFRTRIAPLLAQKCAPCHNPGGKMYATMPFDAPATITSHAAGILRRIKAPEEHALIEQWVAAQPKS